MTYKIKQGPALKIAFAALSMLLSLILASAGFIPAGAADGTEKLPLSRAAAYYIKNLETGSLLKSTDTQASITPSSTAKIMSGLLICEKYASRLDEKIKITAEMAKDNNASRSIGLMAGQTPTVRDLVYLAICGSFNDAVKALAIDGFASAEGLTAAMNDRAARLGMTGTRYANPYGIDSENAKTCLDDLATLAEEAMKNGLFMTASSAKDYTPESLPTSYAFNNYNKLIGPSKYRNPDCRGMNAGNTPGGGYSVVTVSEKNGISYLCIVMGAEYFDSVDYSCSIANGLINWAFSSYENKTILKQTDIVCEIPVTLSVKEKKVLAVPETAVGAYLPKNYSVGNEISVRHTLYSSELRAPVAEGDEVGTVSVYCNGELVGQTKLVTKSSVERSSLLYTLEKIKDFSKSSFFKGFAITAAVLTAVWLTAGALIRGSKKKKRRAGRFN